MKTYTKEEVNQIIDDMIGKEMKMNDDPFDMEDGALCDGYNKKVEELRNYKLKFNQ